MKDRRACTMPLSVLLVSLCCIVCLGRAAEDYRFELASDGTYRAAMVDKDAWKKEGGGGFYDAERIVKAKIRALKARYFPEEVEDINDFFFPATCKQYTQCLQFNDICAKCNDNDNVTCDKICSFPYDCSSSREVNICVDTLLNMECNDTAQCQGVFLDGPMYCSLSDGGLCKPIKFRQSLPHDHCDSDADCKSGNCDDGSDTCAGAGPGHACNTTADCQPEYVCDIGSGTCISRVRNGNAPSSGPSCHDLQVPAGEPTCKDRTRTCENTTTGWQCLLVFDSGTGTPCLNPEVCKYGLACLNGICQPPPAASLATDGQPCSPANASLCGEGMECVCNRFAGSGFCRPAVSACVDQWRGYWNCISPGRANCHPLTDPHAVNSCVRRRCWGQYKRLLECELSGLTCANASGERGLGFLLPLMRVLASYIVSFLW